MSAVLVGNAHVGWEWSSVVAGFGAGPPAATLDTTVPDASMRFQDLFGPGLSVASAATGPNPRRRCRRTPPHIPQSPKKPLPTEPSILLADESYSTLLRLGLQPTLDQPSTATIARRRRRHRPATAGQAGPSLAMQGRPTSSTAPGRLHELSRPKSATPEPIADDSVVMHSPFHGMAGMVWDAGVWIRKQEHHREAEKRKTDDNKWRPGVARWQKLRQASQHASGSGFVATTRQLLASKRREHVLAAARDKMQRLGFEHVYEVFAYIAPGGEKVIAAADLRRGFRQLRLPDVDELMKAMGGSVGRVGGEITPRAFALELGWGEAADGQNVDLKVGRDPPQSLARVAHLATPLPRPLRNPRQAHRDLLKMTG